MAPGKDGYIPTLDGWRAVAILLVILFHSGVEHLGPLSTAFLFRWGPFGVQLFFGISGLLICGRLLEEERIKGRLDLRGFYIRRVLRIQPPALLMLGAVSLLMLSKAIPAGWNCVLAALFMIRNYVPGHIDPRVDFSTGHFWSLAVEEHFYLVLPAFLFFVRKYRARLLLGAAALDMLWVAAAAYRTHLPMHSKTTHHCAFFLLLPAACAVLLRRDKITSWAVKYLRPWVAIALSLPLLALTQDGNPFSAFAPVLLVVGTVLHPDSWTSRFLETAFMRFAGKISFGLYLWQQLFFTSRFLDPAFRPFGLLHHAPWNLLATFAIATASYYWLERPCMRLGHRLARPATAGRPELKTSWQGFPVASGALRAGVPNETIGLAHLPHAAESLATETI